MVRRNTRFQDVKSQPIRRNLCPSLPASYAQAKVTLRLLALRTRARAYIRTVGAASFVAKRTISPRIAGSGNRVRALHTSLTFLVLLLTQHIFSRNDRSRCPDRRWNRCRCGRRRFPFVQAKERRGGSGCDDRREDAEDGEGEGRCAFGDRQGLRGCAYYKAEEGYNLLRLHLGMHIYL